MKVKEFATVVNGATPSSKCPEYYDGDIAWFTPKDLSDQGTKYVSVPERYITQEGYDSCSTSMLPAGSVLMSSRAPIGLLAISTVPCCTNQGFKSFNVDTKKCDSEYLYYYLKHHIKEIEALGSGTTFKEVSKESVENYDVFLPDVDIQKSLVKVLSEIDSKISNNTAICSDLEAMAKLLYDYWFVQFDFPDENGKPYKSSGGKMVWNEELKREIPDGWECATIRELAREGKDKPYTSQNSLQTLDLSVMPSNSIILETLNDSSNFSTNLFEMKKGDILFGSIRPYLKKAGIAPCDGAVVGTVHCFRPIKADDYNFLAITLCNERMFSYATSASQGTKMPVITMDSLMNYKVAYDPIIARQFNDLGLQDVFSKLVMENKQLASLRDFLLPMLMNGQVKVKKGL